MINFLQKAQEIGLDILFPPVCVVCEKSLENSGKRKSICSDCFDLIPIRDSLTCPECGSRFADNIKVCHKDTSFRLAAASSYDNEIVKNLIWKLKYEKKTFAANPLSEVMLAHLKLLPLNIENYLIIPLPLHKARERERGFNQSRLMAEYVGSRLGLPVKPDILKRIKNTKPQAEAKNFEERKKNIEKSFEVVRPELIQNKNIILLDDVFTSGATVSEAIKALRLHDAGKIIALVAAKAGF